MAMVMATMAMAMAMETMIKATWKSKSSSVMEGSVTLISQNLTSMEIPFHLSLEEMGERSSVTSLSMAEMPAKGSNKWVGECEGFGNANMIKRGEGLFGSVIDGRDICQVRLDNMMNAVH
jgi:hypothetical protein